MPLGHWTLSFETKIDHVLACIEIKFHVNKNTIIFAKSSMVFRWPVVILQNCVQFHFPLRGNFLYSKRLISIPLTGPYRFLHFANCALNAPSKQPSLIIPCKTFFVKPGQRFTNQKMMSSKKRCNWTLSAGLWHHIDWWHHRNTFYSDVVSIRNNNPD